jgi:acetyl esterase/lipase
MDAAIKDSEHTRLFLAALLARGGTDEELKMISSSTHLTKDFPPSFVMSCKGDFLLPQAPIFEKALQAAGVLHELKIYGTETQPLWHVFHCDPKLEEAVICNDEECNFYKKLCIM